MRASSALLLTGTCLPTILAQATFRTSTKRGLVFVPNPKHPSDNQIWVNGPSDLTWYYNYQAQPSPAYSNRTQDEFEFVPMLWGTSSTFKSEIEALVDGGTNITHIMSYNEPDGTGSTGGSAIDPTEAAQNWIDQVEPLRARGIKTGAPAVTGSPRGFTWLETFFSACADLGTNCTADFFPVHWYGNFEGLASHIGQVVGTYPNKTVWVTEYALNDQDLESTQSFFNTTAEYFDRVEDISRYSYFGSFRSDVSNVGPNAAMLTQKGELTDIGSWYLGGAATNNIPSAKGAAGQNVAKSFFALVPAVLAMWLL